RRIWQHLTKEINAVRDDKRASAWAPRSTNSRRFQMFNNVSIAKRLAMGFGVVLALLLVVALSGYWGMESVTTETVSMLHGDEAISQKSDELNIDNLQLRRFEKDMLLNLNDSAKYAEYQTKWKNGLGELQHDIADIDNLSINTDEKQLV